MIETIEKLIPTPKRDASIDPKLLVARSFDINKPGTKIENRKHFWRFPSAVGRGKKLSGSAEPHRRGLRTKKKKPGPLSS